MTTIPGEPHLLTTIEELERIYTPVNPNSLRKEIAYVHPHYQKMIEASPFVAIASCGPDGMDCTPRGDHPGFVRVVDEHTLMIPDRRGNNRIDTLRNIVSDPRVALLFLIPGVGETLRVNGRARISVDPALLESFAVDGKLPRSVLIVTVERIYFQCSKAVVRAKLWDPARQIPRSALPSTGTIIETLSNGAVDGAAYDRELPIRIPQQLY
ncbi:MAG TPA: pyridoxamine 5'-phosphate oxidase family protein [Xanthobacteraceae bacterium]|nr:pyridoxamine 5'-phosphate oxidase family protein [Xanthobacteraceae bacterium]